MAPPGAAFWLLVLLSIFHSSRTLLLPEALQTRPLFSGRAQQTVCVDIPRNLSLCHGVGYTTMRLPNLLEHDTMEEVSQQSSAWLPLMHIGCHPDARLFLCSLFSPVCLERDIWPCRSLCKTVQRGCEGRMLVHGFPWPDIFRCDRFPVDNDMCIPSQNPDPVSAAEAAAAMAAAAAQDVEAANNAAVSATAEPLDAGHTSFTYKGATKRGVCSQPSTYDSVADHLCRADIAVRARVRPSTRTLGHAELLKGPRRQPQRQHVLMQLGRPLVLDESCTGRLEPRRAYLIAGHAVLKKGRGRRLNPTIVVPWPAAAKSVKKAIAAISNVTNCTDGRNGFFIPGVRTKLPFQRHSGRRLSPTPMTSTTTRGSGARTFYRKTTTTSVPTTSTTLKTITLTSLSPSTRTKLTTVTSSQTSTTSTHSSSVSMTPSSPTSAITISLSTSTTTYPSTSTTLPSTTSITTAAPSTSMAPSHQTSTTTLSPSTSTTLFPSTSSTTLSPSTSTTSTTTPAPSTSTTPPPATSTTTTSISASTTSNPLTLSTPPTPTTRPTTSSTTLEPSPTTPASSTSTLTTTSAQTRPGRTRTTHFVPPSSTRKTRPTSKVITLSYPKFEEESPLGSSREGSTTLVNHSGGDMSPSSGRKRKKHPGKKKKKKERRRKIDALTTIVPSENRRLPVPVSTSSLLLSSSSAKWLGEQ